MSSVHVPVTEHTSLIISDIVLNPRLCCIDTNNIRARESGINYLYCQFIMWIIASCTLKGILVSVSFHCCRFDYGMKASCFLKKCEFLMFPFISFFQGLLGRPNGNNRGSNRHGNNSYGQQNQNRQNRIIIAPRGRQEHRRPPSDHRHRHSSRDSRDSHDSRESRSRHSYDRRENKRDDSRSDYQGKFAMATKCAFFSVLLAFISCVHTQTTVTGADWARLFVFHLNFNVYMKKWEVRRLRKRSTGISILLHSTHLGSWLVTPLVNGGKKWAFLLLGSFPVLCCDVSFVGSTVPDIPSARWSTCIGRNGRCLQPNHFPCGVKLKFQLQNTMKNHPSSCWSVKNAIRSLAEEHYI